MKALKTKVCRQCKTEYIPRGSRQVVCSYDCVIAHNREKRRKAAEKAQKARDKAWLNANKPLPKLIKETQAAVNSYIRARDHGKPCPSCQRTEAEVEGNDLPGVGGYWDAGHFYSRGSHPEKRFLLTNIWRQCKTCNGGSGRFAKKNHTVSQAYRAGLVERIGQEAVDRIDAPRPALRMSREDMERLKRLMNKRARFYRKRRGL